MPTTLTVNFKGVPESVLNEMLRKGYASTKSDALRYALVHLGEELGITSRRLHARSEEYVYQDFKKGTKHAIH